MAQYIFSGNNSANHFTVVGVSDSGYDFTTDTGLSNSGQQIFATADGGFMLLPAATFSTEPFYKYDASGILQLTITPSNYAEWTVGFKEYTIASDINNNLYVIALNFILVLDAFGNYVRSIVLTLNDSTDRALAAWFDRSGRLHVNSSESYYFVLDISGSNSSVLYRATGSLAGTATSLAIGPDGDEVILRTSSGVFLLRPFDATPSITSLTSVISGNNVIPIPTTGFLWENYVYSDNSTIQGTFPVPSSTVIGYDYSTGGFYVLSNNGNTLDYYTKQIVKSATYTNSGLSTLNSQGLQQSRMWVPAPSPVFEKYQHSQEIFP